MWESEWLRKYHKWVWTQLEMGLEHVFEKKYSWIEVKGSCTMEERRPAVSEDDFLIETTATINNYCNYWEICDSFNYIIMARNVDLEINLITRQIIWTGLIDFQNIY